MESYFFVRTDNKCVKVNYSEVLYVEAKRNYTWIVTKDRRYLVLMLLRQMENILPASSFCRVHRSYIVSLENVTSFDQEGIYVNGPGAGGNKKQLFFPIGRHYRKILHQKVMVVGTEARQSAEMSLSDITLESLIDEHKN